MKQVFQDLNTGIQRIDNVPTPNINKNQVLIQTRCSLISSGTEGMLISFGKSNYINKAKQQPNKVKEVINKISTDGILETAQAVRSKLEQPIPLGYSNVGTVIKVGSSVKDIKVGDRVASNGPHAEMIAVNQNLCALVPSNVEDQDAAFTVIASIALQGIRLAKPDFGETFIVSGLGLIGLLTCKLLLSQGCNVLGIDPDSERCDLAKSFGVRTLNIENNVNQVNWALNLTKNIGVDGAIITATLKSNEPINLAAKACRKRGRVILVGSSPINLVREVFYEKELSFQVSCSYGPGRYDKSYEELSNDYPIAYVRWTEKRNFEAITDSLKRDRLKVNDLISHSFSFNDIRDAYELLLSKEKSLGIIISYPLEKLEIEKRIINYDFYEKNKKINLKDKEPFIGFIGAGNYATRVLIPAFSKVGANFHSIVSNNAFNSEFLSKKYKIPIVSTDVEDVLKSKECDTAVIATRHDSHAGLIIKALDHGKNVFVEKPLCINLEELKLIEKKYIDIVNSSKFKPILMVGFNRRFAPLILDLKDLLKRSNSPKSFIYTCNAGYIDSKSWIQDPEVGGGRLIGEACHFLDLLRFLAGSKIQNLQMVSQKGINPTPDNFVLQVKFCDGSIGSINYFANGSKSFAKERLEVFCDGNIHRLDNFKKLTHWGNKRLKNKSILKQNKGQINCVMKFIEALKRNEDSPIDFKDLVEIQQWLITALKFD